MTRDLKDIGPSEFAAKNGDKGTPKKDGRSRPASLVVAVCVLGFTGLILFFAVKVAPNLGDKIDTSPYFQLRGVDVIGVVRADREEIGDAIGFTAGSPLLETDLVAIRDRVNMIDWVKNVEVKRDLPDRLIITIVEHEPMGIAADDGKFRFVDSDGELAAIDADVDGLALFFGMTSVREYADGARLVTLIAEKRLVTDGHVRSVDFDPVMGYTVFTKEGVEIRVGNPPFEEKINRLAEVLPDAQRRGVVQYIYLTIEGRIVVKVGAPIL